MRMEGAHRSEQGEMASMKPEREEEGAKDTSVGKSSCSEGRRGKQSQANTKGSRRRRGF